MAEEPIQRYTCYLAWRLEDGYAQTPLDAARQILGLPADISTAEMSQMTSADINIPTLDGNPRKIQGVSSTSNGLTVQLADGHRLEVRAVGEPVRSSLGSLDSPGDSKNVPLAKVKDALQKLAEQNGDVKPGEELSMAIMESDLPDVCDLLIDDRWHKWHGFMIGVKDILEMSANPNVEAVRWVAHDGKVMMLEKDSVFLASELVATKGVLSTSGTDKQVSN